MGAIVLVALMALVASSSAFSDIEHNIMKLEGENIISSSSTPNDDQSSFSDGTSDMVESLFLNSGNRNLVLMMLSGRPQPNGRCIGDAQPCGFLVSDKGCCDPNYCSEYSKGKCICVPKGQPCGLLHFCCLDLTCDGYFNGTCK
uniref:Beta/delta-urticatoxin-Uf2a n=1 Tax=Urtica ferox TaxID=1435581 RepID=NAVTA_URTFR|nr:RecName: Full=Beta/delta-urticatoxin-Uf2a; Short=Beta/delta-Uf2a; Flags: Precursor [Urtica ferox]UVC57618.1 beta/delta-urticatoxin-Uf2a [Urtica ferox]